MTIQITRPGKNPLQVESPVMPAAGTMGFGDSYSGLIKFEKLGAFVTNPVTYTPWSPASGTRVVHLDSGLLIHTGLPNPGISKLMSKYRDLWNNFAMPVIMHVVGTSAEHVRKCASRIDAEHAVDALELGLNDDIPWKEADQMIRGAVGNTDKPVLVRVPFTEALTLADAADQAGAGAVVVCAPPRGSARDPLTGRLVTGRVYGPIVKSMVLRLVEQAAGKLEAPVIGCGGIHSEADARDYIEAGAKAVQVDTLTWIQPFMLERIARDLGGLVLTRPAGALADEWFPGMGETAKKARDAAKNKNAGSG
jgi:dihydroorotate dehydrogenase (NAD+) catalytic subunit